MYGQCPSSVNQIGLPSNISSNAQPKPSSTYQNVSKLHSINAPLYSNHYANSPISVPVHTLSATANLLPPPPPPPLPNASCSPSANQDELPLPPPPPPSLLSSIESDVGLPIVPQKNLPKQSPAFNRLQPYIENSVPKPFIPNATNNAWRPVTMNVNSNGNSNVVKAPEPLNKFRSTDIDEIPTPKLNSTVVSQPPANLIRPSAYLESSPARSNVTALKSEENTTQLRNQLNRLLVDRQKQFQSQSVTNESSGVKTNENKPITSLHNPSSTINNNNNILNKHSLRVPSPVPTKSGLNSGSISPLGSVSSLGSAGSASSISPQSSASGARINSNTSFARRPSPLYQNSNEADVDYLTDLLVQGLKGTKKTDNSSSDLKSIKPTSTASSSSTTFGVCHKCNETIKADGSGCSAMGHMFHINCFNCHVCNTSLRGKPFYAVDGKAYCETDYLETLEKCHNCHKPIMDRLLRANGRPYHPECLCCVECGKCLDGQMFTVDCSNEIYCINDFHRKFAPKCSVCNEPIMPEEGQRETVRIVALDKSFHVNCYRCEDCGLQLSSDVDKKDLRCYPMDGHILCKNCNGQRIHNLIVSETSLKKF